MPRSKSTYRTALFVSLLLCAAIARAQTGQVIVGAPVFLSSPGPVASTLLAAPASTDFNWDIAAFYFDNGRRAGTALAVNGDAIGTTRVTPPIPSQGDLPLVFAFSYIFSKDVPPGPGQPGDVPNYAVFTGNQPGNNLPVGPLTTSATTAGVLFGAGNTAQIGFAPIGMNVGPDITDYPFRIGVTNVFSGAGSIGGGGGCTS